MKKIKEAINRMKLMVKRWLYLILAVFWMEPPVQCQDCFWRQADNYITGLNMIGVYGFSVCGYDLANNRIVDAQALKYCKYHKPKKKSPG